LKDYLGTRPDAEGVAIIKAMFKASLAGDPFDMAAFGAHYKPYGAGFGSSAPEGTDDLSSTPRSTGSDYRHTTESQSQPETVEATLTDKPSASNPKDLLAQLRERATTVAR
jgi:hypothetical protein